MRPLNSKEKKHLHEQLVEQYGYTGEFNFTVFEKEDKLDRKYYISTRDVEQFLGGKLRIERIGIYVFQISHKEIRLSVEGSQLIGPHATKHIIELDKEQRGDWMLGKDIELDGEYEQTFHIVKCGEDFMACGKYKNGTLLNYVPKERYTGAVFTDDDLLEQ
jgi:NOL1/NOP2/fmu family ribosome biogenesis protein